MGCASLFERFIHFTSIVSLVVWPGVFCSPNSAVVLSPLVWFTKCSLLPLFFVSKELASGFLLAVEFLQAPGPY